MTAITAQQRNDPWAVNAATIERVHQETPGVETYELAFADQTVAASYRFAPGQFNMLYVPGVGEAAISIGRSADRRGMLRHTIRTVGSVTGALSRGGRGMSLGLRGPFGTAWPLDQLAGKDIVLVAGGIGLAPLRSAICHLIRHRDEVDNVTLLVGARTPQDLLFAEEYTPWREAGINVLTTVDRTTDGWNGQVGVVTLLLERLRMPRPEQTLVMSCGPEVMMRYVASSALGRGIPATNQWVALERSMNCAIGLCGHCQVAGEFVCKDGPVFRFDRVAELLRIQAL